MTSMEALKDWIGNYFYGAVDDDTLWKDAASGMEALEKAGFTIADKSANAERVKNLLGKFLDAWNMGEEPDANDIEEARQICLGHSKPWTIKQEATS